MTLRVVAIDGPAASGKSSTAAAVARRLGFLHVDSGALYRGLTRVALDLGAPFEAARIIAHAEERGLEYRLASGGQAVWLDGREAESRIRSEDITAAVSEVSALPPVRDWVNRRLRGLARPDRVLVLDGRDIGTAVFPEAALKVYLVASPGVRAERRIRQRGEPFDPDRLHSETSRIAARDAADSGRAVAPLRPAADAIEIDTSGLTFDQQVDRIVALCRERQLADG
jgi:cytidylate kinase